jgi:ABC-type multidrug transport system permease subunit
MEQQHYLSDAGLELKVDEETARNFKEGSGWAQFLAILGLVMMGFGIIVLLVSVVGLAALDRRSSSMVILPLVFSIIMFGLFFFPMFYLLQYALKVRRAISTYNQEEFTKAIGQLKSHYKFMGIVAIIIIALYVLMFIIIGISAATQF